MAPRTKLSAEVLRLKRLGIDTRTAQELETLVRRIKTTRPPLVPESVPKITGHIEPAKKGVCTVDVFFTSHRDAHRESLIAAVNGDPHRMVEPGLFTRLMVNGQLMMTDAPMERRTNAEVVERAHGEVFIAGLGLGMILLPILRKKDVSRVLVIEKYKDVVDVIEPQIRKAAGEDERKLAIAIDDVLIADLPKKNSPLADSFVFDVIYFDIWPTIGVRNLKDIALLRRRFKPFLRDTPTSWMGAWLEEHLQKEKRRGFKKIV